MEEKERISIRIVTADYYLISPSLDAGDNCYSLFRNSPIQSVPIIRIFGPTSQGHKTCVHVHGVYPYIFVPNWNGQIQQRDFYNITCSLDTAINTSLGNSSSRTQHVYNIVKVFGRPFYGYHAGEKEFLKIYFYNPAIVKKAAELLQNGAVLKQQLQPYEAHIPYLMQFFIDYNLYGMSFMDVSKGTYRNSNNDSNIEFHKNLTENSLNRQSNSNLEIDAKCSDILNANNYQNDIASNPGLAFILEEEKRRNEGFSQSLSDTFSQSDIQHTKSHFYHMRKLDERLKRLKEENLENNEEGNISQNELLLNDSDVMFTSQGEGIYNLLENLMKNSENKEEKTNSPDLFSPLMNDDETRDAGILLDNGILSDDEMIDEQDHEILSQSIIDLQHSSQLFNSEEVDEISQLDGADGSPSDGGKRKRNSNRTLRKSVSFSEIGKKKNLSRSPMEVNKIPSPKISYPQLQIYTPVDRIGNDSDPFSILKQFKNNTAQKILSFARNNNKGNKNIMMTSSLNAPTILEAENNEPFYSDPCDVTCDEFRGLFGNPLNELRAGIFKQVFDFSQNVDSDVLAPVRSVTLCPAIPAPSYDDAKSWLKSKNELPVKHDVIDDRINASRSSNVNESMNITMNESSCSYRIDEATYEHSGGFQMSLQDLQQVKTKIENENITIMSMELFVCNRGQLKPDPELDQIEAIFYNVCHDFKDSDNDAIGVIVVTNNEDEYFREEWNVIKVENENVLYDTFMNKMKEHDPDIILGYEIEMSSWGYLIERGDKIKRNDNDNNYNNMKMELSRILQSWWKSNNKYENTNTSELSITGRIVLNVWRLMRHEISLQSYTFENILFHILHIRLPKHSDSLLTQLWNTSLQRWIVMEYLIMRVKYNLIILNQLDVIGRTSEMAKLFGILFYEVLSRGSQYRVESMMLRMTKRSNYVLISPNIQQRANMKAPSSLPLIMEPQSNYYNDPVIVLDFQSLYPSIIIAYNYCFSTCLGKIDYLGVKESYEFGCVTHQIGLKEMEKLRDNIQVSPCAVAFVDKNVKVGILPAMLQEILYTRLIVKKSMKANKDDKALQRVLHARQLALKLIANVTYGYTAANFSGRMPCIEVGDSVVSKGRETLERAIELVTNTTKWNAKVIYGDTDSLFVLVKGRTREEAFEIGTEIADAVTNDNPNPVKLKLEKVYQPCILQTKKRYVGYLYENAKQEVPIYDAKGIETVRRDGCPAIAKILKKSLKILMNTCDLSLVKKYVQKQFSKIISGKISMQELTFAREYRGLDGYRPSACVPALHLARQALLVDKRGEPRRKERVPYVIIAGHPGVTLIKLVRSPNQVLNENWMKLNVEYYITRAIIPPLERCFALIGVNVHAWYKDLPRKYAPSLYLNDKKNTISQYFHVNNCISCRKVTTNEDAVCVTCVSDKQILATTSCKIINTLQSNYAYVNKICESCCGRKSDIDCVSLDCPVLYRKYQTKIELTQIDFIQNIQHKYLSF